MTLATGKVGIICCSGEDLPGGTISRVATRLVLEKLRRDETVTLCLPLFLAGGEDERAFARVFPTIAVDGCNKKCAEAGTRKFSGKPVATIVVSEIMKKYPRLKAKSREKLNSEEMELAMKVAEEIVKKVDQVLCKKNKK
ncbi:putative zinc-binding protein [Candidatus Bathyarchaeota archaeon]|nr:putative zinc-binding protein [Candidatus Bathyarchaeota archaeon]